MQEKLAAAGKILADCASRSVWGCSDDELTSSLDMLQILAAQTAALQLEIVRELDGRGIPRTHGAANTTAWLRDRLRISDRCARDMASLSAVLDRHVATAAALAEGQVNPEQAAVIIKALESLPVEVGLAERAKAETILIGYAAEFEPRSLAKLSSRILSHVAPELADAADAKALERAEKRAYEARAFSLSPQQDGRVRLTGWLHAEAAAIVNAALDPLTNPARRATTESCVCRQAEPNAASALNVASVGDLAPASDAASAVPSVCHCGAALGQPFALAQAELMQPPTLAADGDRTPGQRRADALVEVCRLALNTGELPANGGDQPQLVVTIDHADLVGRTGAGTLDNGQSLTPQTVRRIACHAEIIPAVLGGQGQVLDVGRARRLFTGPLRRALVIRDRGCSFPSCDRPPRWCDGHHIQSWLDGGKTELGNGVLVCGFHHRLVHQSDWIVQLGLDGHPEWIPPEYIDPERKPRRNAFHRRP